jgi:hypothetical protein
MGCDGKRCAGKCGGDCGTSWEDGLWARPGVKQEDGNDMSRRVDAGCAPGNECTC